VKRKAGAARVSAETIANSVTAAILERRLAPGTRIGEEELAAVFQVSRTVVRQALTPLASQGIVAARPKKGWFIVEPSEQEVREVFGARRLIQTALVREFTPRATREHIRVMREHLRSQRQAIASEHVASRTHLLGDFDVQIAVLAGNQFLARIVADLTTRSALISMLYQTTQHASASADQHERIIDAIEAGDAEEATRLMDEHLRSVEDGLQERKTHDPVRLLKETLAVSGPAEPTLAG
jgi:DNA-binding GntR family transcriptional regulator